MSVRSRQHRRGHRPAGEQKPANVPIRHAADQPLPVIRQEQDLVLVSVDLAHGLGNGQALPAKEILQVIHPPET